MTAPTQIVKYRFLDTKIGDGVPGAGLMPLFAGNGTPVNGANGSLAGVAIAGALFLANDGGTISLYQNTGTQTSPTWSLMATSASITAAVIAALFPPSTFTLNGATPVTVANAAVTASSQILITLKTVGGSVGAQPHPATITPGTGFTVVGTAGDTSVYNYTLIG